MMHLTSGEEWLLQLLDENCGGPTDSGPIEVPKEAGESDWGIADDKPDVVKKISLRFTPAQFRKVAYHLKAYHLVEFYPAGGSYIIRLTGDGSQRAREVAHPDLVAKASQWARRHPRIAPWIIGCTVSGAVVGWIALVFSLFATLASFHR